MKRRAILVCGILILFSLISAIIGGTQAWALEINGKAALLMDVRSGQILYEDNINQELPVASLTKLMTLTLILEAVERGELSLDDIVTASPFAASKRGSRIWLESGEQLPLNEMLYAIAVGSANDAAVAVAEFVAGSEQEFVRMMNDRAGELGLSSTTFLNASGLPTEDGTEHTMTALDVAKLARHALTVPRLGSYVSTYEYTMRADTTGIPVLWNNNKLLRRYTGVDGLKTGFTTAAGYCMAATAVRDDLRLIAVVLGSKSEADREDDVRTLLDYGFRKYHNYLYLSKGTPVGEFQCKTGDPLEIETVLLNDFYVTVERGRESELTSLIELDHDVKAPIKAGTPIGTISALFESEAIASEQLTVSKDVHKASFIQLIWRMSQSLANSVF